MPSDAMRRVIEMLRRRYVDRPPGPSPTLHEVRESFAPAGRLHPLPDDVEVVSTTADGVPAYWLNAPDVDPRKVLVYVHGGGFSIGSLRSHGELAARLGRAAGMRVLFPEYRLAPEHPFPAGLDDLRTTWRWFLNQPDVDVTSLAIAGDSAGAGLAMSLLVALRDAGEQLPVGAVLLSPFVDLTASGASIQQRVGQDAIFTRAAIEAAAATYLQGADPLAPLASPLFADLTGLPLLLIQVGEAELLLSDSERLAKAARAVGVDVVLQIGAGLPHGYQTTLDTPEAAEATAEVAKFLQSLIGSAGDRLEVSR